MGGDIKHALPITNSKNMRFNYVYHLFIFLICMSIGFICSLSLQNFPYTIQTSLFSLFPQPPSLLSLSESKTVSLSLLSAPPLLSEPEIQSALPLAPPPPSLPPLSEPKTVSLTPLSTPPLLSQPLLSEPEIQSALPLAPLPPQLNTDTQPPKPPSLSPLPPLPPLDAGIHTPQPSSLSPLPPPQPPLNADTLPPQPPSLSQLPPPLNADTQPSQPPSLSPLPPPPQQPLNADTQPLQQPPPPSSPLSQPSQTQLPPLLLSPQNLTQDLKLKTSSNSIGFTSVSLNERIPLMHNMSDEELFTKVSKISTLMQDQSWIKEKDTNITPKVAFMFLTPGPLPLSPLWELFFKGHQGLFSIYVHPHPSYNETIPPNSIFYGRRITSQPVYWGDISMIDAEKRLLANALLDPLNQRFVLLSQSCIPLFNFTTTYNYLINSNQSYIGSFDDKRKSGRGRYNPRMSPNITIRDWRKGSQWIEVNRDLALGIVLDRKFYGIFREFCHPPCYNDEHYIPTLVHILYGALNANRTVTYVDWSIPGPHPRRFVGNEVTEEFLDSIRFGSAGCVYNEKNTTPMCFLFGRKFTPSTLGPLLRFAHLLFGF